MKKISLFLTLLLTLLGGVQTAVAQSFKQLASVGEAITDLSSLTSGSYYALKNNGRNWYLKYNILSGNMGVSTTLNTSDVEAGLCAFKITSVDATAGTYTIQVADDKYMPQTTSGQNSTPTTTAYNFVIAAGSTSGTFTIKNNDNTVYFNGNPNAFVGWGEAGGNSEYQIIPVTLSETASRCVTFQKNGATVAQAVYADGATVSSIPSSILHSYYWSVSSEVTVGEGSTTVELSGTAPMTLGKYSTLKTRTDKTIWFVQGKSDNSVTPILTAIDATDSYEGFSAALWKFEESGLGVKIYNKQYGKYLKSNDTSAATLDATGSVFYVERQLTSNNTAAFTLTPDGTNPFGRHTDWNQSLYSNTSLGVWSGGYFADEGSYFVAVDIESDASVLAIGKSKIVSDYTNKTSDYVLADYTPVVETLNNTTVSTLAELETAATTASTTSFYPAIESGAYYRIKNNNFDSQNDYLSSASTSMNADGTFTSQNIQRASSSDALVPQIWQLRTNGEHAYTLYNPNNGAVLKSASSANDNIQFSTTESEAGAYTFTSSASLSMSNAYTFLMKCGDVRINAVYGAGSTNVGDYSGNHDNDGGNFWRLIKVTTIPVSISDAKYASLCLPVAVSLPEETSVKAYYSTKAADGEMELTEITDGIIPANNGVILYNEDGATTVTLTITTTDHTLDGNILSGANAKVSGLTAETTYGLAKNTAGNAAFLLNSLTYIPANKAYLTADNYTSATADEAIQFNFGGNGVVSAISNANAANNEGAAYYDLQGRRVLYPTAGIYVKNGRKVLVK